MKTGRKPLSGLLILCLLFVFSGGISSAQINPDSLTYSELQSFEELEKTHTYDHDQYIADTLYAHIVPSVDLETIEDRASCMQLDMPLVINKTVCGFIHFFTVRKRNYTQTMLERKNYYFPIFEYYLKKHEMPDALKYLSIVESGLNFKANSKAGAAGLWQFMPGTGTDFYLAQNRHIDERQNPYLATEAACKFLKYLYRTFNDWELALAAYNCGPGNVMKAMRRSGKRGFWEIYDYLPKETRSYVPQFHAVVYSMNFAAEHNIHPDLDSMLVTVPLDTFLIDQSFDIVKLETILGLPQKTLHHHNPTIRNRVYPSGCKHPLLVPQHVSSALAANLTRFIDSASVSDKSTFIGPLLPEGKKVVFYQARKGENLEKIAGKYDVALASLKKWNHLPTSKLKKSKRLKIYLDQKTGVFEGAQNDVIAEKSQVESKSTAPESTEFHVVKKGEKLYQVAMRYGIPLTDIRKFNHLSSSKINAGQKLYFSQQINPPDLVALNSTVSPDSEQASITPKTSEARNHIVKRGEGLFQIAKANGASVRQLKEWNNLIGERVVPGQTLVVSFGMASCSDSLQNEMTEAKALPPARIAKAKQKKENLVALELAKTYRVQKGDTLYSITRKFTKLSIKDLMRLNNLKNKNIKPGQQLIVG